MENNGDLFRAKRHQVATTDADSDGSDFDDFLELERAEILQQQAAEQAQFEKSVTAAVRLISEASAVLIASGAGMSIDSGMPDFRHPVSWFRCYPSFQESGLSYSCMASEAQLKKDPQKTWAWYTSCYNMYDGTQPHEGYRILERICSTKQDGYFVYTSNVDGHFAKAGFDVDRIVECHGRMSLLQCSEISMHGTWNAHKIYSQFEFDEKTMTTQLSAPHCRAFRCDGIARPNYLLFGDHAWNTTVTDTQTAKFESWLSNTQLKQSKLVIIEVGTGITIPTVRATCERTWQDWTSKKASVSFIRINPEHSLLPDQNNCLLIRRSAIEVLRAIQSVMLAK